MSIVHPSTSLYYSSLKSNCVYENDVSNPVISLSKNFFLLRELAPVTPSSPSTAKRSIRKNKSLCSGSQLYCDLTRSSVFKRILINNGNSISKNKKSGIFSRIEAVIKLQSFFRMVKVIRQYQDKISNYVTGRSALIIDALARRGNWPKNIIPCNFLKKSRIKQELKLLYPLVEMYNKHETFKKQKIVIVKFLFLCLLRQNKDNLTAHDIKILLLDILCTNIPYTQIEGCYGIFSRTPYNGQVDFLQFYSWYDQNYIQMEKKVSKFELIKRKYFGFNLPDYFIGNFIQLKSAFYDVVYQLYKYDSICSDIPRCVKCGKFLKTFYRLCKHIVQCKKKDY